jgi:hypothetical protein
VSANTLEKPNSEQGDYVKIGLEDATRLRAKVRGFKRAALNIQLNAKTMAEWADDIDKLLGLIIETDEL